MRRSTARDRYLTSPFRAASILQIPALLTLLSWLTACAGSGEIRGTGASVPRGEAAPAPVVTQARATPYNILLIIADDLSYDHYGFAGHPVLKTPSIDTLAAESLRFPNAYVSSSCRPTLATLLTGLPEQLNGVTYMRGPLLGDFRTVADRLDTAGYTTFQAGKFWEGLPNTRGFTAAVPFDSKVGNLAIGRTTIEPVVEFMERTSAPWFVWFSPKMPHRPHTPPAEFSAMYENRGLDEAMVEYFAMISWFDAVVGALLQHIDDNTVVIFLADNGYVQSGAPQIAAPRSKTSSYEHGIRTQLLIRHPGYGATLRTELASAVDVTATVLSIAGADHSDLPGRNLLVPAPADTPVFGSRFTMGMNENDPPNILLERWVHINDMKLVDVENGEDQLHNLALDPDEKVNLIDDAEYLPVQARLRHELEILWGR